MNQEMQLPEGFRPAMTLLNSSGDITVEWDDEDEPSMLALIEKKMKDGYRFFILKPRKVLPGDKKVEVKSIAEVKTAGYVIAPNKLLKDAFKSQLGDTDVEQAVAAGHARLATPESKGKSVDSVRPAKSAQDVVRNQSMAVRPVMGG